MKTFHLLSLIFLLLFLVTLCLVVYTVTQNPRRTMRQHGVIFAGTVRNVAAYLPTSLHHIEECGRKFRDFAVVLYENDSSDETRALMEKLKRPNYHYIYEDGVRERRRTVRISNGRNKILDQVRAINTNSSYDYLVMLDLDDVNSSGSFVASIESCFKHKGWDVLTANQRGLYYDLWALRKKKDMETDCWLDVREHNDDPDAIQKYVTNKQKKYKEDGLLQVDSAFGGAAIYRLKRVPPTCRYNGAYEDGTEKCEHVDFHRCIKQNGGRIFINTSFFTS